VLFPPISHFGFIAPLTLKLSPKGVIQPTLRTTDLKLLMTKRSRKIIKMCLPVNIDNNFRLLLCGRLFEESPAWFCSHLLSMIQACTHHSAIIVKSQ